MRVVSGTPWRLEEAENFRALSVRGRNALPGVIEGDHAWLEVAALRAAGPDEPEWQAGFDAMIAFAAKKGWMRDGAVRAHVEDEREGSCC